MPKVPEVELSQLDAVDEKDQDDPTGIPRLDKFSRSNEAEDDIAALRELTGALLVEAFRQPNENAAGYRQTEALIAFMRRAIAANDKKTVTKLFDLLKARCDRYFGRSMRGVRDPEERMDIQTQVLADLAQGIFRGEAKDEYLQARFWDWLKLRTLRRLAEAKAQRRKEFLLGDLGSEEDRQRTSRQDEVASYEISAEDRLLIVDALSQLPEPLRDLFILRHYLGWEAGDDRKPSDPAEPTLKDLYGITARGINKRLAKAETLLANFRKDPA